MMTIFIAERKHNEILYIIVVDFLKYSKKLKFKDLNFS